RRARQLHGLAATGARYPNRRQDRRHIARGRRPASGPDRHSQPQRRVATLASQDRGDGVMRIAPRPAIMTVISTGRGTGFLLSRGVMGVEAFDAGERSLGVFADAKDAHAAVLAEVVPS